MNWQDEQHILLLRKAYAPDLDRLPMTTRQHLMMKNYLRDVFIAGHTEGEKARRAAPARKTAGVESRRTRSVDLCIQLLASVATLAGMWVGSTTAHGAELYLIGTAAWYAISWRQGLIGIWPLNVGATLVSLKNLWSALA